MLSKKSQLKVLMYLFIATFSIFIILTLWNQAFSKAPDKAAEDICFVFNAWRNKYSLGESFKVTPIPIVCKKIEKTVPDKLYDKTKEGAIQQLSDLTAKCWRMFLEGRVTHVLDGAEARIATERNKCFICYQFTLDKDITPISANEFDLNGLGKTYKIGDTSDQCAGILGGYWYKEQNRQYCRSNAGGKTICIVKDLVDKDFELVKKSGDKFCILNKKNQCLNKGGTCGPAEDSTRLHNEWKCESNKCYVSEKNVLTYRSYIEKYGGIGHILLQEDLILNPSGVYAITFVDHTFGYIIGLGRLTKDILGLEKEDLIKGIMVTELGRVANECAIQLGTEVS